MAEPERGVAFIRAPQNLCVSDGPNCVSHKSRLASLSPQLPFFRKPDRPPVIHGTIPIGPFFRFSLSLSLRKTRSASCYPRHHPNRSALLEVEGGREGHQMVFGQVVIGPPGSGKTTYCNGMSQFLKLTGRKVAVVNLDPANDALPYECAVNIEDLIKLSDVMVEHSLGPNGGLVYCMDYLEQNIDWLQSKLKPLTNDHYFIFDFPGQVELFFLHSNAKNVLSKLIKNMDLQLIAVHLVDAHLCCDPGNYVSALLLSLTTMLHLELPHINVLSKIDLIENYGKLAYNLDFYTDVQDLSYLQYHLDQDSRSAKYRKLTKELCDVIEGFGLVDFYTLNIQDKESVGNLLKVIDKINGYIFSGIKGSVVEFSKIAAAPLDWDYYRTAAVQEKYIKDDDGDHFKT